MIIAASHKINFPGQFWATLKKKLATLPSADGIQVIQILPARDISKAVGVWEASSIEALDNFLRQIVFDWSEETYFEIDAVNAVGLSL
jgi:hypothetical protein